MADLIRIKGGSGVVPTLLDREIAYSKDEEALYIGTGSGNKRLCGVRDIETTNGNINEANSLIEQIISDIEGIKTRLEALEKPSE